MANAKTGLKYYMMDTDRYQDRRIKRLKKDCRCPGIAVYDYILCEIYRVHGCYIEWDKDTAFDVAEYLGLKETTVLEIVKYCGAVGLFNKELLSRGIITSASIQRRYLDMCNRAKRQNVRIPECCAIPPEETQIIPEESPKTPEVCREVKKSKVKETLSLSPSSGEIESLSAPPTDEERESFFKIFFFKNYKNPAGQVDKFVNYYQATNWVRGGGGKVTDRMALARSWEPKEDSDKNRFPGEFLAFWQEVYDSLSAVNAAKKDISCMYLGLYRAEVRDYCVFISISPQLRAYLDRAVRIVTPCLERHYPNHKLKVRTVNGNNTLS